MKVSKKVWILLLPVYLLQTFLVVATVCSWVVMSYDRMFTDLLFIALWGINTIFVVTDTKELIKQKKEGNNK